MVNLDNINRFRSCLRGSEGKPHLYEGIISSVDIETIAKADSDTKLMLVGSYFAAGRHTELARLLDGIDFSEIAFADRSFLALCIFKEDYEKYLENKESVSAIAESVQQILRAICPEVMSAHTRLLDKDARQQSLLEFEYATTVDPSVHGVVFFREFMFTEGSRKHEFGHRIQTALSSQGWNVLLLENSEIVSYSCVGKRDFVLVDTAVFGLLPDDVTRCACFERLRQYFRKIIVIEADPWSSQHSQALRSVAEYVDYIWGFTTEWELLADPCFKDKGLLFPNVGGFDHLTQLKILPCNWDSCRFNFTGSVLSYNLNRAYWVLELLRRGMPVSIKVTYPGVDDGLDRESSLRFYARELASTYASLNFTTRKDGSRIITGRSVEIISLNRLLIQEHCPSFHKYYTDGEHFLEFNDIDGLCTAIDFLSMHPKVAQKICAQGYEFYHERYSSRKMVEYIQMLL